MSTLLERMAAEPCERFTGTYTCDRAMQPNNLSPDARDLADRYCPPCRLRAALAEDAKTRPTAEEVAAAVQRIQERLSWPSLHWGVSDLHSDALPHIARAALGA